ncbi:MAG: septum site-determining protein MinC [Mastigocoleus sp. MO_167.B18]|uniref:septum site-determining protein MinC n=1 Tax=Mastigocoleus sp. MO_188.B34 TaxID=3036635 RepID=UPI00261EE5FB|nr:septum site-determining protein MinC [Mastigocoleus sp. MO_188.B34]MDJ0696559.1 septum site-determining protein MinC [Mastigocoleus sp. MO_188.B34]MDJ0774480.1 septum site-determining protein MinC [Mastigocoleus sp. MO_167.B18]
MTSDSVIPDLDSNSAVPDVESHSNVSDIKPKSKAAVDGESKSTVSSLELKANNTDVKSSIPRLKPETSEDESKSNESKSNNLKPNNAISESQEGETDTEANSIQLYDTALQENSLKNDVQVQFKTEGGRLLLILPTQSELSNAEHHWLEIWQQIKVRLNASDRLRTPNTNLHLVAGDRLLDGRQLQQLAETLSEFQIQLKSVSTNRRQTAIAAVSAGYSVEQMQAPKPLSSEPKHATAPGAALYMQMTVRSGIEIRHPGTIVVLGDVNPGGIVIADGDILVWGRLRGIAHAGAKGNRECQIMALQMEPTQLRIADAVARAPEKSLTQFYPEVAYVTLQGIRVARATDFTRTQLPKTDLEL